MYKAVKLFGFYFLFFCIPAFGQLSLGNAKGTGNELMTVKAETNPQENKKKVFSSYHSYQEIIDLMDSLALNFPGICNKTILGSSVQGRELSVLKISDNVALDEYEAEVLFVGGIHGDEVGGPENCIRFARMLCLEYGNNQYVSNLVNNREIWIYPMLNPDGRENLTRFNANGVDLDRDFGYMWDAWGNSTSAFSQVETRVFRDFVLQNQFSFSLDLQSGDQVILYPWFYRTSSSQDDETLQYLADLYADNSGYSDLLTAQGGVFSSQMGVAAEINYGTMGNYGFVLKVSTDKQPPVSEIMYYYGVNEPAMLAFVEHSVYGINGLVTDQLTGDPVQAYLQFEELMPFYNDPIHGDYFKYLLPGNYNLKIRANGYRDTIVSNIVITEHNTSLSNNIQMARDSGQFIYKVNACRIPTANIYDQASTWQCLGRPDNQFYSLGQAGWIIVDMQYPFTNGPEADFCVFEGDPSSEGYECFVSMNMDGPWIDLGPGLGTTDFDLSNSILNAARYIKIVDDGDGPSTGNKVGFDLDAIQAVEHESGVFLTLADSYPVDTVSGNSNFRIDPGETVDIVVGLLNTGNNTAQLVEGTINADPQYVLINKDFESFGNIPAGQTEYGTFNISLSSSTPSGHTIVIKLEVTASAGAYQKTFDMPFTVGQIPILILDLDGNNNSGSAIAQACDDLDMIYNYTTGFPDNLNLYTNIFVCLGCFDENYILTQKDGEFLAAYLDNGGNLYLEGGDTWYFDAPTEVHPYFNIEGLSDGDGDLDILNGRPGFITDGMNFEYDDDNLFIDRLEPIGGAMVLFNNSDPHYNCAIANDATDYKTIGTSFEFGGMIDGDQPSTKKQYLKNIIQFFEGVFTDVDEIRPQSGLMQKITIFPNPIRSHLSIGIDIRQPERFSIDLYTVNGEKIKNLFDGILDGRENYLDFQLNFLSTGNSAEVFLLRICSENEIITKKIIKLN
jgi:zinc carboxypeptidase